jgi:hypothetical protein
MESAMASFRSRTIHALILALICTFLIIGSYPGGERSAAQWHNNWGLVILPNGRNIRGDEEDVAGEGKFI